MSQFFPEASLLNCTLTYQNKTRTQATNLDKLDAPRSVAVEQHLQFRNTEHRAIWILHCRFRTRERVQSFLIRFPGRAWFTYLCNQLKRFARTDHQFLGAPLLASTLDDLQDTEI